MKKLVLSLTLVLFCACSEFTPISAQASQQAPAQNLLEGSLVIVHLDNNTGLIQGVLVEVSGKGVLVRLNNNKLYFYPLTRVSGVEQL